MVWGRDLMKLYSGDNNYKLYQGNMLDMLEVIEPNSIDAVVTDPPYELGFMGKSWDASGIAFQKETWEKCLQVLKPGGHLLAFGGSRTHHRIAVAIEDAGFEIRDCIMYLFGSGFPKSMNIGLAIDKRGGDNYTEQFAKDLKKAREDRGLTVKQCDDKYCGGTTNWMWFEGRKDSHKDGIFRSVIPEFSIFEKIVKDFVELEKYRDLIKAADREVIGTKKSLALPISDQLNGWGESRDYNITIPSTEKAKQWDGWGTQLKPSYEAIILARKPVEGTIVDNVLKYGVGGINIDDCRVVMAENDKKLYINKRKSFAGTEGEKYHNNICFNSSPQLSVEEQMKNVDKGRFPANTILTYDDTDYEEVCGGFPQSKGASSQNNYSNGSIYRGQSLNESATKLEGYRDWYNDDGSAARYFYCAKASRRDRDEGLPKDMRNVHPTIKPVALMSYLVRLVTPNGGTILDPFNGSGSTGKAVMWENRDHNKGYKYIGIELTEQYLPIAQARIEYAEGVEYIPTEEEKAKEDSQVEKKKRLKQRRLF